MSKAATTEQIRKWAMEDEFGQYDPNDSHPEFDLWLQQLKFDLWQEGAYNAVDALAPRDNAALAKVEALNPHLPTEGENK